MTDLQTLSHTHTRTIDPTHIGFIGLGAMGLGTVYNISKSSHLVVKGYNIFESSVQKFANQGDYTSKSVTDVAENSDFLGCMVANAAQSIVSCSMRRTVLSKVTISSNLTSITRDTADSKKSYQLTLPCSSAQQSVQPSMKP